MQRHWIRFGAAACLGALALVAGPASAGASAHPAPRSYTCTSGTVPSGDYASIVVKGLCFGPAAGGVLVDGPVTVEPGASLIANYPSPKKGAPEGDANWRIAGALIVDKGATLALGCEPHFGCKKATSDTVGGGLRAFGALGVIVHATSINGSVTVSGGGGGLSCRPSGVFTMLGEPVYSDFEDDTVKGDLTVSALSSCWLGLARDAVDGSVTLTGDELADPDAIEVLSNAIQGDLGCSGNSRVWDSTEAKQGQKTPYPRISEPNVVLGTRSGQCVLASPAALGAEPGPGAF
ncbi:MAG: hypothetical protein M0Z46_02705 [Actinomycetota bacterium]|jgi:hypothetical protein|nr:hypothetical protein [Actinomycetota bacterium]